MPFTFSHPAIVLPFTFLPPKWYSLTGLVIGSLTPDFEYFLRMRIKSEYSHTIDGLFWFDLPLGLALTFLFHVVIRNGLYNQLPLLIKARLIPFETFDWTIHFKQNWLVVLFSLLIGAASHVLWDSFTHTDGYFVQAIPALQKSVDFIGLQISVSKIVQHSSTFVGGLTIAFVIYKLPSVNTESTKINVSYWSFIVVTTLTIVLVRVYIGTIQFHQFGHVLVTCIAALIISLTLGSFFNWNHNTSKHDSH